MHLKRKIFHNCIGSPRAQKAVSLALLLKRRLGRTSTLHNWSANKLHNIAGTSPSTIKKYMPIMRALGLVHFEGRNNQHLVVSRIASNAKHRNIDVDAFCLDTFKDAYNSLRAFVALAIQARKDFIRHTLQTCKNPSNHKEFIKARKTLKRLVKKGTVSGMDATYTELGISYRRIAQETGNCNRTAQRIIKYALKRGWCNRYQQKEVFKLKGISFRDTGEYFTFSTKNYIILMHANRYSLSVETSRAIGYGIYSR